uniref:Uncharacterized protein n=1 Tax=Amazona collaria TaxID=241587 RepID=A0A8B9F713_9PSIT
MFLYPKQHKTPVSTYTDSYRPPYSVKKALCDRRLVEPWKENKFVTQVSAVRVGNLSISATAQVLPFYSPQILPGGRCCLEEPLLLFHNPRGPRLSPAPLDTAACHFRIAEKYRPVVVGDDKYMSRRTSPSTTAWSMEPSYLPLLPKVDCACTMLVSIRLTGWLLLLPLTFPHHPSALEKVVAADMVHRVPVYTVTGKIPFQSYYVPCSGRHCCLRGIDYYLGGTPATRKKLFSVEERAVMSCCYLGEAVVKHTPRMGVSMLGPIQRPWDCKAPQILPGSIPLVLGPHQCFL